MCIRDREIADAQRIDYGGSAFTKNAAVTLTDRLECRPLREATEDRAGAKAAACGHLLRVAKRPGSGFKAIGGVYIPFGSMEACLRDAGRGDELERLKAAVESAARLGNSLMIDAACQAVRDLINATLIPPDIAATICAAFPLPEDEGGGGKSGRLAIRSSSNVEDLAGMSGSGLYHSVLGVPAGSSRELAEAVSEVWASLYTRGAVMNRLAAGVSQVDARMAVFVQEMAAAEVSFLVHTAAGGGAGKSSYSSSFSSPSSSRGWYGDSSTAGGPSAVAEAELAVGLGETSSAAAESRGSPWRLQVDQTTGSVRTVEFASLGKVRMFHPHSAHLGVTHEAVDYSRPVSYTHLTLPTILLV